MRRQTMEEGGSARELIQAQTRLFHDALSVAGSMSLRCAVQLGIPDIIHAHGRPVTPSELHSALPHKPPSASALHRLMRLLAHMGYFAERDGEGEGEGEGEGKEVSYGLTPLSRLLLRDSPSSLSKWLLFMLGPYSIPLYQMMGEWYQQSQVPTTFEMAYGRPVWELAEESPDFNQLFMEALASDTSLVVRAVVEGCREAFMGLRSLVDVGGGNGTLARAIAEAFPHIKCTVYDLPHVIATMPESPLVDVVGGSMFEHIPKADAVILKHILHDWSDEHCVEILKRCKDAIPSREDGGKVLIVDVILNSCKGDSELTKTQFFLDIGLVTCCEGKERQEHEWKKIFIDAGFKDYKITPLGIRSLLEVFP